jgi:O-antigen ligase/polysaccharide polymerase Wzy-like membrane protein
MRRAVLLTAAAVLLGASTVLAFFSGGYFDEPRLVATIVVWALVLAAAVTAPQPLPESWPGRVALGGLALITAWTGVSLAWAPLSEPASDNLVRLLLYSGALVAAAALLRDRLALGAVEPALALGALVVIGYGLAGRLLPGVIELTQSAKAFGRLEQPITYWNAEGALAAIGLVLCARLAGTESRPARMRSVAAAAAALLGAGVYLSYSRGAIAAAIAGLIVLLAAAPSWSQLRAAGVVLAAAALAAALCEPFPAVTSLAGDMASRKSEGAIALALLAAVALAAAFAQAWIGRAERRGDMTAGRLAFAGRLPAVAAVTVVIGLAGLVATGLAEQGGAEEQSGRQGASRLTSFDSARYEYWRVALDALAGNPLRGIGSGGFRVEWLRERPTRDSVLEVHSLPLEMATELGLPGLIGFLMLLSGVGVAAARALSRAPTLAPGACAGATVWFLHAAIDWDWQIPAVTLPALVMGGALIALGDGADQPPEPSGFRRSAASAALAERA